MTINWLRKQGTLREGQTLLKQRLYQGHYRNRETPTITGSLKSLSSPDAHGISYNLNLPRLKVKLIWDRFQWNVIKIPAKRILRRSSGCRIRVDVTPPDIPANKCSYLTWENTFLGKTESQDGLNTIFSSGFSIFSLPLNRLLTTEVEKLVSYPIFAKLF